MKEELSQQIIQRCPILYRSLNYIEAPDGWFNLILQTSITIEQKIGPKKIYLSPLPDDDMQINLPSEVHDLENKIYATQIKSKFGSLRFYVSNINDYFCGVIDCAERLSSSICENCGSFEGKTENILGWIYTLCPLHKDQMLIKRMDQRLK